MQGHASFGVAEGPIGIAGMPTECCGKILPEVGKSGGSDCGLPNVNGFVEPERTVLFTFSKNP